ncbi:Piso0_004950 [Millerozyma farinosa CBS 7064]|uniref:Piso0_004950 protein n=1 Tax=Pichia sorbitophila (strain ATCC MYA-4447 / BCRC 22081 / CBS 7064 / NBRC 10061 / NRRL Y-12695) TaxID=559304 RepID=G8Y0V7_PICSO|nr:Piso0_004950 [Millerozyma farinosa CBS 7064]
MSVPASTGPCPITPGVALVPHAACVAPHFLFACYPAVRHALQFRTNGKLSCVVTSRTPPVLTCTFSQVRSEYFKHRLAWGLIDWFAALEP